MINKLFPQWFKNYFRHFPTAVLANLVNLSFIRKSIIFIGVTGTDGKTTTVNLIYQMLKDAGKKVSMVSTVKTVIGEKEYDTGFHVTNPGPFPLQKLIREAINSGTEIMVLEVTSNGLDQFRVWGIKFDIGVITNITHEHLDYHKTFENYRNAKAKLIINVKWAILNKDDPSFDFLKSKTHGKVISFGLQDATVNLNKFPLKLKLPGEYNKSNALAAVAVGQILKLDENQIRKSLESFDTLSGRMEEISNNRHIKIFVDFAHTPNALDQALKTLREKTKGQLIAVFGAASERDVEKRPMMGEISAKNADIMILTDEDPRFEDSLKIINQIAAGAIRGGAVEEKSLFKIPDRQQAIKKAIELAKPGDTIGVFGKGHEKSMNYKGKELPWSDKKAVEEALDDQ